MVHHEFLDFLKEYKVISLAVAFVMGAASNDLIKSFVNDVLMPIISPIFVAEAWREATLNIGPVHIAYGLFLAQLFNFLILALIVFIVVRKLFKAEEAENNQ